ncbi:hypothetical protein JIN85_05560 [Luteolibacter pohnpeiensis]|uniref:Uncharacterized protein n=1 Tax=Luteolibacter pohnpeiensis TaxID=454153 RepID=A0A934VV68_9BACT|nr:hypothetical protein [Luteolibacter pohnpeiensis]MBK1881870.1 hypothetical protein [Luteolibacter pohnpeiensis]
MKANPRTLKITAAGLVLVAALVCIFMLRDPRSLRTLDLGASHAQSSRLGEAGESANAGNFRAHQRPVGANRSTMRKLINNSENFRLTQEQIEAYLASKNRSSESLLTAYNLSNDESYLREAMEKDPENPRVLLTSLQITSDPAETLKTLEVLKRVDPNNALGNLLSAKALLDQGDIEAALQEMELGQDKSIESYLNDQIRNTEEAFLSAGFSPLESKFSALNSCGNASRLRLGDLSRGLMKSATSIQDNEDTQIREQIRNNQLVMANQIRSSGNYLLDSIVADRVLSYALQVQQTPEAEAQIAANRERNKDLAKQAERIGCLMSYDSIPDSEWSEYFDRLQQSGEISAIEWMLSKHP